MHRAELHGSILISSPNRSGLSLEGSKESQLAEKILTGGIAVSESGKLSQVIHPGLIVRIFRLEIGFIPFLQNPLNHPPRAGGLFEITKHRQGSAEQTTIFPNPAGNFLQNLWSIHRRLWIQKAGKNHLPYLIGCAFADLRIKQNNPFPGQ